MEKDTLGGYRLLDPGVIFLPGSGSPGKQASEAPQILKAIAAAAGRVPGIEGMTLLLKIPRVHSLSARHRKIKLD